MWDVLEWLNPDEASLNLAAVLPIPRGTTVPHVLEAVRQLVLRHESLHTAYFSIDGELTQCVKDEIELDVFVVETSSDEEVAELAHSAAIELANDAFDISSGVQLRVALTVRDGLARAIALVASHMAVDAGSFQIVQSELKTLLSPGGGQDGLPKRSQQPVERAEFEASPAGAKLQDNALAFWRQTTSLASPSSISRLSVPADDQLAWASIESKAITLAAHDLAARYSVSPSAVILASLGLLIGDFAGEPGPVFRSLIATRFRSHDRQFVGAFNLNSIIHVATDSQLFADHVRRTAAATLKAFVRCEANPRRVEEVINDVASARGITPGSYCFFNDVATGRLSEPVLEAAADPAAVAATAEGPGRFSTAAEGPGRFSTAAEGPGRFSTAAKGTQIVTLPYQGRQLDSKFFVFLHSLYPTCVMRLCKDRRFIPDASPSDFFSSLENLIVRAATTPEISVQELLDRR